MDWEGKIDGRSCGELPNVDNEACVGLHIHNVEHPSNNAFFRIKQAYGANVVDLPPRLAVEGRFVDDQAVELGWGWGKIVVVDPPSHAIVNC